MTISIIVPTYNEERYLPKTIASIKHLDHLPDEIIVVDGSSTDNTPKVAKALGAKVIIEKHSTIGYARQKGLLAARGDIVAFTDADTQVPRNWLSTIERQIQKPNVVGVFGGFRVHDGPWWYRVFINVLQPALNTFYFTVLGVPMACGQNMAFYKKKALSVGGFPEEFKIAEDVEIARRLMKAGKIIFRQNFTVLSSGRRGYEGFGRLIGRIFKAFFYYFLFRRADRIGFPDVR